MVVQQIITSFRYVFYLVSVDLSFLAETRRHVFRLSLLLVLVLEKQILPL